MLQHAVYMRPTGLHDVPKQILCSLQGLVESPGIQAVLSFALSHLPVATQPSSTRPSGPSYELLAQEELELNNMPRQSTAYSVDRRRATVLAALDNVRLHSPHLQVGCAVLATSRTTAIPIKCRYIEPCEGYKGRLSGSSPL